MRYKSIFIVYPRKLKSGKKVYYYQTYDKEGKRTTAISTGQTNLTAAKNHCIQLYKAGKIIPQKRYLFSEFAKDFFIYDKCYYIKGKITRGDSFSPSHAHNLRVNLEKHILPYFGNIKLDAITASHIEKWLFAFSKEGLSNVTANHNLNALRIILNEAERFQMISLNPVNGVRPLKKDNKIKGILTHEEVKKIFNPCTLNQVWDNYIIYTANLLSACSGLRLGEIQGLQVENIKDDYIHVCYSYDQKIKLLKSTKTGDKRDIPLPAYVFDCIKRVIGDMTTGFIFSNDSGKSPILGNSMKRGLYKALGKIGINEEARTARNITFHSHRHWCNTFLQSKGISINKIQKITGHRTQEMTDHYTHFSLDDFRDVQKIQESLFPAFPGQTIGEGVQNAR